MINGEALGGGSRNKMTQQRQKHWGATLALIVGIALLGPSTAWGQKLRVAYTAFAGTFTVLWVGVDSGLYKKYGADMELLYIGSSTKAVQALLGGDIDIVYSAAGAVVDANLAGADLSMIGCQYDTGQTSFFTTNVIASVGDLKGKAVGVTRFGAFSDFVARHVLKKHRLVPVKDVALLQLGGTLDIGFFEYGDGPLFKRDGKPRRRQSPGDDDLLDSMVVTGNTRDASVQEGAVVATVEVTPGPNWDMVVDRKEHAAPRTREAGSRIVLCLHIDSFLGLVDDHVNNVPGCFQAQENGVQVRCIHGRSPPRASPYRSLHPQESRKNLFF
jgi:hypothetical protein